MGERCMLHLVGKLKGKKPFGRTKHRYKDNIETDLTEIGCMTVEWIHVS
jgi:hypothetical protein